MAPFQCDRCWFTNMEGRVPRPSSESDTLIMSYIRRVNLDVCWAREPTTVEKNLDQLKFMVSTATKMSMKVPLPSVIPWPICDDFGMGICVMQLVKSRGKGRNAKSHNQFATIRKLRSAAFNLHAVTAPAAAVRYSMKKPTTGDVLHLTQGPTQSELSERFALGCSKRMGAISCRNLPISCALMHKLLESLKADVENDELGYKVRRAALMAGVFSILCYTAALRGPEGFKLDAAGLIKNFQVGVEPMEDQKYSHVLAPLLGRFKNEIGERLVLVPIVSRTKSGLEVREWLGRLVHCLQTEGNVDGPAFCDTDGWLLMSRDIETVVLEHLRIIQATQEDNDLLGLLVEESFGIDRSFRRGATTRQVDQGIDKPSIDLYNRWRNVESRRGRAPTGFSMMEHYVWMQGVLNRLLNVTFHM